MLKNVSIFITFSFNACNLKSCNYKTYLSFTLPVAHNAVNCSEPTRISMLENAKFETFFSISNDKFSFIANDNKSRRIINSK